MNNIVNFRQAEVDTHVPTKRGRIAGVASTKQVQVRVSLRSLDEAEVNLSTLADACAQALSALQSAKRRRDPDSGIVFAKALLARANHLINVKRPGEYPARAEG